MAECIHCPKSAETDLPHLHPLCAKCFCVVIEKRIRKYARLNKVFSRGDRIIAVGELNSYLIPRIIKSLPAVIVHRKTVPKKTSRAKIFVNWTLDDETSSFMENILTGKTKKSPYHSILKTVSDQELTLFAKYKKIQFRPNQKNPEVQKFLDTLESRHPETMFSLMKSIARF
jgi:hypothetical protein